uniref:Uncharacterized protein n=1 Tax=Timema monikensis TaxID=170555 RepID=A0A7R9EGJ1_9NEOP|nr:unnamed protein product [Timema monikensis]
MEDLKRCFFEVEISNQVFLTFGLVKEQTVAKLLIKTNQYRSAAFNHIHNIYNMLTASTLNASLFSIKRILRFITCPILNIGIEIQFPLFGNKCEKLPKKVKIGITSDILEIIKLPQQIFYFALRKNTQSKEIKYMKKNYIISKTASNAAKSLNKESGENRKQISSRCCVLFSSCMSQNAESVFLMSYSNNLPCVDKRPNFESLSLGCLMKRTAPLSTEQTPPTFLETKIGFTLPSSEPRGEEVMTWAVSVFMSSTFFEPIEDANISLLLLTARDGDSTDVETINENPPEYSEPNRYTANPEAFSSDTISIFLLEFHNLVLIGFVSLRHTYSIVTTRFNMVNCVLETKHLQLFVPAKQSHNFIHLLPSVVFINYARRLLVIRLSISGAGISFLKHVELIIPDGNI